jgi:hypothetical protein
MPQYPRRTIRADPQGYHHYMSDLREQGLPACQGLRPRLYARGMAGGEFVRMIAKLAYLHSPSPDRYILFFQEQGKDEIQQLEISEGHLANIIADGAHYAFRKQCNRVPVDDTARSVQA